LLDVLAAMSLLLCLGVLVLWAQRKHYNDLS
jgi:hypothetical protein